MLTISGFLDHLDYARRRSNILFVLSLASLLAWWLTTAAPSSPGQFDTPRRQASWEVSTGHVGNQVAKINNWAGTHDPANIDRTVTEVRRAESALGADADPSSFFALGSEFDRFFDAWSQVRARPLPSRPDFWTAAQFSAFERLARTYELQPEARSAIVAARHEFAAAKTTAKNRQAGQSGDVALATLESQLANLKGQPDRSTLEAAADAKEIAAQMEEAGFDVYAPFAKMVRAGQARRALETGSLDVIGFSIPGIVVRILLPLLLLFFALDLLFALRRTERYVHRLTPQQVRTVMGGYPWLFSPRDIDMDGAIRRRSRVLASAFLLASTGAAIPLVLSGPVFWHREVGLLILGSAAAAVLLSVATLATMKGRAASEPPTEPSTDDAMSQKLVSQHFQAADSALGSLGLACAAAVSFFLVFLMVPRELQGGSASLHDAASTRQKLETVYKQRLLDQPQVFVEWCETGCGVWTDLEFAKNATPAGHAAFKALSDLAASPLVRAEGPSTVRVKDLVAESRARLADLDIEDLRYVLEVLYRDSFYPLQIQLGALQRILATSPLPEDAAAYLPTAVKARPVENVLVPFVMPFRVFVEKSGFADRLVALPPEADIQILLREIAAVGATRVDGFDRYQGEMAALESELGKVRLKVAGVSVPRSVARDIALMILGLLSLMLAFRLRAARLLVEHVARTSGAAPDSSNVPGLLFLDTEAKSRWAKWLPDGLFAGAVLLTQSLVIASPGMSSLHPGFPVVALLVTAISLGCAVRERRYIVRLTRDSRN